MALADLNRVKTRVIQILNANPEAYAASVSGDVGAFPYDQEITDAIFQAEAMIVREGYFNSVNPTLGALFTTTSSNVASGALVPEIRGNFFVVELSQDNNNWHKGIEAAHIDDVVNLQRFGASYIEAGVGKYLYKFDGGRLFTPAAHARVKSLTYAKTEVLQINETEEFLLIATSIRLLTKNASPAPFDYYAQESARGIQQLVTDGAYAAQTPEA